MTAEEILGFINGDTSGDTLTHWCLPGCCSSDKESWNKLVKLLIPWMGRGFAVPLLSRFKHYGPASSYIKVGCGLCRILPRILETMQSQTGNINADVTNIIDTLLADSSISATAGEGLSEKDLQTLVGGMLEADINYGLQNAVRRKMMIQAITRPNFCHEAIILDCLLQVIEHGINILFSRTKLLHQICNLGTSNSKYMVLIQKSKAKFLHVVSGQLGKDLMGRYEAILLTDLAESIEMGMDIGSCDTFLQLSYELVIVGITDCWRRLVHDFKSPPFCFFGLLGLPTAAFVQEWSNLQAKLSECSGCIDAAFGKVLLSEFPAAEMELLPRAEQDLMVSQIEQILRGLAAFAPLSSDLVEIKHGNVQWAVHRRAKQKILNPRSSRETSFLQSCIKQYDYVKDTVGALTLPAKQVVSSLLKRVGVKGRNQHSKKRDCGAAFTSPEMPDQKKARTDYAKSRNIRGLCGWNIFQREKLQQLSLHPDEYKQKVGEISIMWKTLQAEEKEAFEVQAQHENCLRQQLAEMPLAVTGQEASHLEEEVGRNGCKKLSARRLGKNLEAQQFHELWDHPTQFADCKLASFRILFDLLSLSLSHSFFVKIPRLTVWIKIKTQTQTGRC